MSFVRSVVPESSWFCSNTCFHSGHQQVSNPIIPYVGPIISGGLKPGTALYVQGTVPDNANQFSINFQTGQNKYDDIAFHFNPWIGQFIYLNSFQNGNWEVKECVPDESFTSGAAFNMFIVIKADGYEVYVNDLRRYMFQHRIPLEKVTTLSICGDVNIDFFGLCENWRRPCVTEQAITSTVSSFANVLPTPAGVSHRVIQPVLPHVGEIKERLKPEMALFFQGALPAHPREFEINLQTGQSDIAFHFNPQIGRHVSLNSFRNGQWETEECVSDELFTKGAAFYMFVVITSVGYEVYVNGLQLCVFNHRVPLENVSAVSIYGDVAIPIYGFIDNWSKLFNFKDLLTITGMGSPFSSVFPILEEVSHPVICPALPYVGSIRGGIRPDMAVFFQGILPAHAKKFAINFQMGQSDTDDIAFHFNPRIGQHVYLNSFRNGQWETEETAPDKPFTKEAAFNMLVIINSSDYEVHVNGLQLCTFKHRMALEKISTLAICGDISISLYGFIDNWSKMDQSNVTQCTSSFSKQLSFLSEVSHPVIQPALPYIGSIKDEIRPDVALLFHGAVSEHGKRFEINLLTGDSDSDDVAFHISPQTGKSVTLNSFINGSWETEEYASSNPFTKGVPFHLFLVIQSEGYQVYVNGVQLCTFKHRIPLEKVSALSIRGDITTSYFGFIESWSSSSMAGKINETADQSNISGSLTHIPSEISHPVINPELPYVGAFQAGLRADTAVFLQGVLPADAKQFTVNLLTGESEGDDIAFHISPRIGDIVTLNSFRNGSWETEEHASITAFTKEAALSMFIVINSEGYEVYVNDSRLCAFKHRIPLVNVSALGIFGDVIINYFGLVENWSDSSMVVKMDETQDMSVTDVPLEISHPVSTSELLHVDAILEGPKTDETVTVQMALHADTNMAVNFKTIHIESEICSESSMVTNINEVQDMSLTVESLIDVPSEISHPVSSPSWSSSSMAGKINETADQSNISGSLTHIPSEISHPVINPELPYVGAFQAGLRADTAVFLQGVLPADAKQFTVNLLTGKSEGDDIAFHISPRIGDIVTLNSFRNGSWETEEHASVTAFTKEAALSMFIVINSEGYEVYVNDSRLCAFKHRIPLVNVSALGIFGDVIINYFGLVENWSDSSMVVKMDETQDMSVTDVPLEISHPVSTSELLHVDAILEGPKTDETVTVQMALHADTNMAVNFKTIHIESEICSESSMVTNINEVQDMSLTVESLIDVPSEISHPVSSPELPYVGEISGELKTDMAVVFQGSLPADAKEFTINLLTGESEGDDIAFHISPRIGDIVTLNSFRNGSWETEEHASITAFTKEAALNMFIVINSEGYEVYVNDSRLCTFKHRIPLVNVSALGIFGDVTINYFGIVENWSDSSMVVKMDETQDMSVTDVPSEISHPDTSPELLHVDAIVEGPKTDEVVTVQMALHADTNTGVDFKTIHIGNGNCSESSMVMKMNEIQDIVDLTDVPPEISHPDTSPELLHVDAILEGPKTDETVTVQMALHADTNTVVNFKTIHNESEICSDSSMVTDINEVQDMSLTVESLIDVPSEISHPVSSPELLHVDAILEGPKTDETVTVQMALHADTNMEVNFKTMHIESEICSESSIVANINEVQDMSLTVESLIDVPSEISHPVSSPELLHVDAILEGPKTDETVTVQMALHADTNTAVNFKTIHIESEICSESSMVTNINEVQDMSLTVESLIDVPSEISHPVSSPELLHVDAIVEGPKTDETVTVQMALHADTNTAVNFKTIHIGNGELLHVDAIQEGPKTDETVTVQMALHADTNTAVNFKTIHNESEICSESSMITDINEVQDMSLTVESLIDVPSEISHPVSSPELLHVDAILEGPKTDETVTVQMALHADTNTAVNFKTIHIESEICSESSMVTNINEVQDMSLTVEGLIDVPSEISHPVSSPVLPYVGEIPEGLKTDMAVVFHGALPADAKEFTINLLTGESEGDDIAFHISPRIGDIVALNSFRNGSWETEEHASITAFTKEAALSMFIVINSEGYEVYVNDSRLCTFKHRIPLVNVFALGIFGDVIINYFGLVENWSRSFLALEKNEIKEMTSTSLTLVTSEELVLPFVGSIPGGIRADMAVLFYGTIFADSNEFEINFQTRQSSDDIAFSINPQIVRFLVLSSLRQGSWDSKDFASDKEAAFNMVIVIKLEGYEVYVNGLQYCTFKHHVPLETITSLGIRGDVFINFIGFIANWSNSSTVMENIKITGMERSCWRPLAVPSELSHPVSNPVLPYVGAIPGKTRPDMAVLFQGALPADANEFTIDFKAGESDGDDIAFHIRPQLGHHVALNCFRNGNWESEESVSVKPFTRGAAFNMFVVIKSDCFEIYVNGLELCTFKHRVPVENISTLAICGDVSINFIGFIETWSTFSFIIENNELTDMRSSSQRCSSHQMIISSSEDF